MYAGGTFCEEAGIHRFAVLIFRPYLKIIDKFVEYLVSIEQTKKRQTNKF